MAWCVLLERRFFETIPRILDNLFKECLYRLIILLYLKKNLRRPEILKEHIELDPENLFRKPHKDHQS